MTVLPAEGRTGRTPKWPLLPDVEGETLLGHLLEELSDLELRYEAEEEGRSTDEDGQALKKLGAAERRKLPLLRQRVVVLRARIAATSKAELALWRDLWKTPQAVAWERLKWTREIAQYTRWKILAEMGSLRAGAEARQLADRLGLTPMAMRRLMWRVSDDEVAEKRATRPPQVASAAVAGRTRFQVVDPEAAGE